MLARAGMLPRGAPGMALVLVVCLALAGCAGPGGDEPVPVTSAAAPAVRDASRASPAPSPKRSPEPSPAPSPKPGPAPSSTTAGAAASGNVFPLDGCRASFGHGHHGYPATDIFAPAGCRFVAPASGVVDEVSATDEWQPGSNRGADRGGRSVSVIGDDGVRYYGSHLGSVAARIRPGARVRLGQLLGRVGNSGSARRTSSHLHFGLSWPTRPGVWWVRRGVVDPWPYLRAWQDGKQRSPVRAVASARRAAGAAVPRCSSDC